MVGVATKQVFAEYGPYHVININEVLQNNGCFQNDCDLYKNGGSSDFAITYEQARVFLDDEYSDRVTIMPREKNVVNAIFPCGVEATMHKRFNSLKESLEQKYKYERIHFIVKDSKAAEEVQSLFKEFSEMLTGIKTNFIVADTKLDIFEKGLALLKENSSLDAGYVIITDPTFAPKVEMITTSILSGKKCFGIASAPIKDWKVDMNLYGYGEALGTHEKAAIAWARSAWNFKARQAFTEMKTYKATHLL